MDSGLALGAWTLWSMASVLHFFLRGVCLTITTWNHWVATRGVLGIGGLRRMLISVRLNFCKAKHAPTSEDLNPETTLNWDSLLT